MLSIIMEMDVFDKGPGGKDKEFKDFVTWFIGNVLPKNRIGC